MTPSSLGGTLVFIGLVLGFMAFLSAPALMTAVLAGLGLGVLGLRRYLRSNKPRTRSLRVPGLGTIEYRITPN